MEVVAGSVDRTAGGPFSRHNVQEWSRLDQLTGLLEHARVETDHWTNSTSNSSHHFGKVGLLQVDYSLKDILCGKWKITREWTRGVVGSLRDLS